MDLTASSHADRRAARRVTRASHSNFYYSFVFLPKPQKEAIHAIYAFCREVDDSVDGAKDAVEAARRVEYWRRELVSCAAGTGAPEHPIARALSIQLKRYPIDPGHLEQVIEGVAMDVTPRRYRTFEELKEYCYRVASAVGLVCIEVFGYRDPAARDYAISLGLAFQMTNILRDLRGDAESGRVYLPADEMARFGCAESDLSAGRSTPAFLGMMRFQIARTRELFERARAELPRRDRRTLFAAEIMGAIYESILARIERSPADVLTRRVGLSRPQKILIAARVYMQSRLDAA